MSPGAEIGSRGERLLRHCAPLPTPLGRATLAIVSHRGRCFGITSEHVLGGVTPGFDWPFSGRLLARTTRSDPDLPHDCAVLELAESAVRAEGKSPLDLASRSATARAGDALVALGCAGEPVLVAGLCPFASDRRIVLLGDAGERDIGGMSGGPVFLESDGALAGIVFTGIVRKGRAWINAFPFGPALLDALLLRRV